MTKEGNAHICILLKRLATLYDFYEYICTLKTALGSARQQDLMFAYQKLLLLVFCVNYNEL